MADEIVVVVEPPLPEVVVVVSESAPVADLVMLEGRVDDLEDGGVGGPSGPVAWVDVTGKPSTFPPSAHTHPVADVTGLAAVAVSGAYADLSGRPTIPSIAGLATTGDVATASTADRDRANHTGTQSLDTTVDSATRLALTAAERSKVAGIATGATANSTDAQLRDRSTHTGTQSADTLTDGTTNKAFLATERTKLAGVATGATANATDAQLRDRATHAGTQSLDTTTDSATRLALTATERTKVAGIAVGATANSADSYLLDRTNHTNTQAATTVDETTDRKWLTASERASIASSAAAAAPERTFLMTWMTTPTTSTAGASSGANTAFIMGGFTASATTVNAFMEWAAILPAMDAGTYRLRMTYAKGTNQGIVRVIVNGTDVGTVDQYGTFSAPNLVSFTGIVVAAGRPTIRLQSDTKNASSSAFQVYMSSILLERTGP